MFNQKPTFFRVFLVNGAFFSLISALIVVICSLLLGNLFEIKYLVWYSLLGFLVGSIGLLPSSIKRYRRVIFLIEQGYETRGKIIEKYLRWGRGYIVYEYEHHGQIYRASENLFWTPASKKLKIGQEVTAFVNHQSPRQSLLLDLYQ